MVPSRTTYKPPPLAVVIDFAGWSIILLGLGFYAYKARHPQQKAFTGVILFFTVFLFTGILGIFIGMLFLPKKALILPLIGAFFTARYAIKRSPSSQSQKLYNTFTTSEEAQQRENFIELVKSAVHENRLEIVPNKELLDIYKRAKSIDVSSIRLDLEFSKSIHTLFEEIERREISNNL